MLNRFVGCWLTGLGVVLAGGAWAAYAYSHSQWKNDWTVDSPFNATPFAVAAIVGGVLFHSGAIFLAVGWLGEKRWSPADDPWTSEPGDTATDDA